MRKFRLLFAAMLSMLTWTCSVAQTNDEYEAALAAIESGEYYYISTDVDGIRYYLTTSGTLTDAITNAGIFSFINASTRALFSQRYLLTSSEAVCT